MNISEARRNMVSQQIRSWGVTEPQILELFSTIRRERFVPIDYEKMAFADFNIPLDHQQSMWLPQHEGRVLQTLEIEPREKILEIGTGSGYFTALLATLGKHVFSIDYFSDFTGRAYEKLQEQRCHNASLITGNGAQGWSEHAPYDVIVITGRLPHLPDQFKHDLTIGGRLFAILGEPPLQQAVKITRVHHADWVVESLFEMHAEPILEAVTVEHFSF